MKIDLRMIGYGAAIWLIAFIVGIITYPIANYYYIFFKTIMVVTGAVVGAIFTVLYFTKIDGRYLEEGILIGIVWVVGNWILDFAFLLPLSQQPIGQYLLEIGLRYLSIPAMTVTVGYLLDQKSK